jgi:hypothetical protein
MPSENLRKIYREDAPTTTANPDLRNVFLYIFVLRVRQLMQVSVEIVEVRIPS